MGDVLEFLVDGVSGLAPGGVEGSAIVVGVCSRGEVGKGYVLGKRSDLASLLGTGPLVDRVRDVLATAGQEPIIIAVPVQGYSGGYVSQPHIIQSQVKATTTGVAQINADIVVKVKTPGPLANAVLELSLDGGKQFTEKPAAEALPLGETGGILRFPPAAEFEEDAVFRVTTRVAIGPIKKFGLSDSPLISVEEQQGGVLAGAQLVVQIARPGNLNEGTYQYSVDGGDNFTKTRTIPVDGKVSLPDYGIDIIFPAGKYFGGTEYTCDLLPPAPSIVDVITALQRPLSLYDVEFVFVAGPTDSVDWVVAGARAKELWNAHRPTYFKMEARLPHDGEDLHDYCAYLLKERQNFAEPFVQVCAQFGEVTDSTGQRKLRNWCGLQAGRVISIPVQRATGRYKDGPIAPGGLPIGWEEVQPILESAGYLTAKKYAGAKGVYWGDSRTMAEDNSDFIYEEAIRTVFKAIRKMRLAALKSMYDDESDPLGPEDENLGDAYLLSSLETALDTMVTARPKELIGYRLTIPPGQDRLNNGTAVETRLIAVGVKRAIRIYASYAYAGGKGDPRLQDAW